MDLHRHEDFQHSGSHAGIKTHCWHRYTQVDNYFFSLVLMVVKVMVGNLHLRGLASHATVSQAFKAYFVPFGDAGQKLIVF